LKLVPFPVHCLRLCEALPFDLYEAKGRVMLVAGDTVDYPVQFDALTRTPLLAQEAELTAWMRPRLASIELAPTPPALSQQWRDLVDQLDDALHGMRSGRDWRGRLFAVHGRARALFERRPDASLYHHVYEAGHSSHKYSCHHALLTLVVVEHAATKLGWSQPWVDSLGRAALTMNVAMRQLQDRLATTHQKPTAAMRTQIATHAEASAALLEATGLGDPLCLAVVRLHHEAEGEGQPLAEQAPERQLARLLRRVDIFTAKISRRATRSPMSPVRAAREACLGADGMPDEIGGAMLKAVGLYPPGSFVALASGEMGIVVARGERANVPRVAALVSPRGSPLGEPVMRDTEDERYAVRSAVTPSSVKVRPPHDRLLA
jgi:HD-GYP domain-containing protein (c-di-GMP phosphodiesterase class II)